MTQQLDMFEGVVRRDAALRDVQAGAPVWCEAMLDIVRRLATGYEFTTDQLWMVAAGLGMKVGEPRAMGAVIRNASTRGLIESTKTYRKSERPECHARPVLVWRRR